MLLGWPQIEGVDICLSLAAAGDLQKTVGLKRFQVLPDVRFMQAHIEGEAYLPWKAVVVLPRVAQQHRKGELVPCAQIFRLEEKIRDLREAAAGSDVSALEDDVLALFEDIADGAAGVVLHAAIIGPAAALWASKGHKIGTSGRGHTSGQGLEKALLRVYIEAVSLSGGDAKSPSGLRGRLLYLFRSIFDRTSSKKSICPFAVRRRR